MTDPTLHQRRLALECVQRAKLRMGEGWGVIGSDLQWALIAVEVLYVFTSQDPATAAKALSAMTHVEGVRAAAYDLHWITENQ